MGSLLLNKCLPNWLPVVGVFLLGGVLALEKAPADSKEKPVAAPAGQPPVAPVPEKPTVLAEMMALAKQRGLEADKWEYQTSTAHDQGSLNKLGAEGWELVSVTRADGKLETYPNYALFWKRRPR